MFKYIRAFFKGLYKIVLSYPKICRYAKNKEKYPFEERYNFVRGLINIFFKSFDVTINSEGFEQLKEDETYLFVSNHQSMADALALVYLCEKPMTFVSKIEAQKFPFVGKLCNIIDVVFIDRDNIRDAVKMVKTCKEFLSEGMNVAIYPEGTRTKDDSFIPGEYKAGALKPAYETKKSIAVTVIDGSYKVFSKKFKKNLVVDVKLVNTLQYEKYFSQNTTDLAKNIEESTKKVLLEGRKQNGKS